MKRPPRPGETILVFECRRGYQFKYYALVRCHRGMFIHFDGLRNISGGLHYYQDGRVHRSDEGQTWFREGRDADAAIAELMLRVSALD